MKDTDKMLASSDPEDVTGCIPDDIKVHSEEKIKIVPDENKVFSGTDSVCRIAPEGKAAEFGSDTRFNGVSNNGEKIRIAPDSIKTNGKIFT